jgi:hypothetical protein
VGDPLTTAKTALEVVNKGIETIKLVLRPRSELQVVEGGFAKALPDGISDSLFEGGDDCKRHALHSEYNGGDEWYSFMRAAWNWDLFFTWKANVKDGDGNGAYILDASVDVSTTLASDQIAWEWKVTFPGKGRWFDRSAEIVELPFKLNLKCTHSLIYDKLWYEQAFRGWIRGDGTSSLTAM